ncbi:MAG: M67 family metallopeptidase [Thermoanaerobaculia bacterium]
MTRRRLAIAPGPLEAVRRHAAEAYPEECCGFLLGRELPEGATVERTLAAANEHPAERSTRYLIPPERVLAARREARAEGFEVVGYYHSHPDRSGEPSRRDLEDAWPAVSYLIVPVAEGLAGRPRSWRLRGNGQGFEEETLEGSRG